MTRTYLSKAVRQASLLDNLSLRSGGGLSLSSSCSRKVGNGIGEGLVLDHSGSDSVLNSLSLRQRVSINKRAHTHEY